jgi:hypothetical protein
MVALDRTLDGVEQRPRCRMSRESAVKNLKRNVIPKPPQAVPVERPHEPPWKSQERDEESTADDSKSDEREHDHRIILADPRGEDRVGAPVRLVVLSDA